MYPQYTLTYIICLLFFVGMGILLIVVYKMFKKDNDIQNYNERVDKTDFLEKINILNEEKKKIGNVIIKEKLKLLFIIPILWGGILLLLRIQNIQDYFIQLFFPICLIDLFVVLTMIPYINIDNRQIKKYNININHNIDIAQTKYLRIFRTIMTREYQKYFIVDENNNLLYKIQEKNTFLKYRYLIIDNKDIQQGEIISNKLSLTPEYIIRLIGEEPYLVRSKLQFFNNYDVVGRNYIIKGNTSRIENIIYNLNEEEQAFITATFTPNGRRYVLGSTEVSIVNSNNIDLTLISFCVTLGNFNQLNI